jgi:hypothetical protein
LYKQGTVAVGGAFTLNVNSTSAAPVRKQQGAAVLVANDILASQYVLLSMDASGMWEMQGQTGNAAAGGSLATQYPQLVFPDGYDGYTTNFNGPGGNAANGGVRWPYSVPVPTSFATSRVQVSTLEAGKYMSLAIYSQDLATKYCETTPVSIGAAGAITLTWVSGCVLQPGSYMAMSTSDATGTGKVAMRHVAVSNLASGLTDARGAFVGYTATAVSTGSGASIAFKASVTASFTASTIGPVVWAIGQ